MQLPAQPPSDGHEFYRAAVHVMRSASLEFLVGGAYAMRVHTGIKRDTKDFDVLMRPQHLEQTLAAFRAAGYSVEMTFPHWLAKVRQGRYFIDLIFRSGNGLCDVDDEWFEFSREADVLGLTLPVCAPEEMIWQKAYIMERERFDGADVQHLLRSCGRTMDWERLLQRFAADWPVLLCHLILFNYVYPGEQDVVPPWVMERMITSLGAGTARDTVRLCRGTLLSRLQYLEDVEQWGYSDARRAPKVKMNEEDIRQWTAAARAQAESHGKDAA
jgi:putative nucleotidyltransferase-like protein